MKLCPNRKAQRASRVLSQKDDVHLCIMCLRAIMNYQVGFETGFQMDLTLES